MTGNISSFLLEVILYLSELSYLINHLFSRPLLTIFISLKHP